MNTVYEDMKFTQEIHKFRASPFRMNFDGFTAVSTKVASSGLSICNDTLTRGSGGCVVECLILAESDATRTSRPERALTL